MQNDILCTRWPPTASCEIRWLWTPREHTVTFKRAVWVSALHQRPTKFEQHHLSRWCCSNLVGAKEPKVCQETVPGIITPTAAWTVDARQGGAMLSCCLPHVGLYHQSATADMDTLQCRCFLSMICLTLVSLGEYCLLFLAACETPPVFVTERNES